jgi:hypothetical protein
LIGQLGFRQAAGRVWQVLSEAFAATSNLRDMIAAARRICRASGAARQNSFHDGVNTMDSIVDTGLTESDQFANRPATITAAPTGLTFRGWLIQDSPYIAMLSLALIGITFRMPLTYWLVLTPVFGIICIVAGWRHFSTRHDRLKLVLTQALSWGALVLAIVVLYDDGSQGVLNANASSLAMITLLALGTFLAGLQAEVWRTCGVGVILFLAVPAIGWLQQSSVLLLVGTLAVLAVGGATWYLSSRQPRIA